MSYYPVAKNPEVVYDFRPLVQQVKDGIITRHEYEEIFRQVRNTGKSNTGHAPIEYPVGASTAPIICGVSQHGTYETDRNKRLKLLKTKGDKGEELNDVFEVGHIIEDITRERLELKTGFPVTACDIAYTNPNWPFMLVNPDGFITETDEDGNEQLGLVECKSVYSFQSKNRELMFKKHIVPEDYYIQIQYQLECCNLDFCYLPAIEAFNITNSGFTFFRIERDRDFGVEICNIIKNYVEWLKTGIMPDELPSPNLQALIESNELMYSFADSKAPKKTLNKNTITRVRNYETLDNKAKELKKAIEAEEKKNPQIASLKLEAKGIEKQMEELEALIKAEMGTSTLGEAKDKDDCFLVRFTEPLEPKFAAKNKRYLKEDFPEVWKALLDNDPAARKFSIERIEKR